MLKRYRRPSTRTIDSLLEARNVNSQDISILTKPEKSLALIMTDGVIYKTMVEK